MLSIAARKSHSLTRTFSVSVFRLTLPGTQLRSPNTKTLSTSQRVIPPLRDVSSSKEGEDMTAAATASLPSLRRSLFIGGLPRWEEQQLEEKLGTIFGIFGEILSIRVGAHTNGNKYAHINFRSAEAAGEAMRVTKEVPLSLDKRTGQNITVKFSGQSASSLFFTGFLGSHDILRETLKSNGYNTFRIFFFLGEHHRDGRLDFPDSTDIHEAYKRLNGLELENGVPLNLLLQDDIVATDTKQTEDEVNQKGSSEGIAPDSIYLPDRASSSLKTRRTRAYQSASKKPPAPTSARQERMKVLMVGNLPPQIPEEELEATVRQFFGRHGSIASVEFATDNTEGSQRCCYMSFVHSHAALLAFKNPLSLDNRQMTMSLVPRVPFITARTLYCKGFLGAGSELRKVFGKHAQSITKIKILYTHPGGPAGGGIVEFQSRESAEWALIEMDGRHIRGRRLELTFYKPP